MLAVICDDSPDDRRLEERELRREFPDMQIQGIDDDAALAEWLAHPELGILLTDYQLRWTDGLAVLRRAKVLRPTLPVIMVTGSGNEEVAAQAMAEGAFYYVPKSRIRTLGGTVRRALEHAAAHRAQAAAESDLRRALRDKDALIGELFHRVNNNLQLVTSFVRTEAKRTPDAEGRSRLDDLIRRVQAIALVQERLYLSGDYAEVDIGRYLDELSAALLAGSTVAREMAVEPVHLPVRRAVPFGLVANEIIVNALKHAFTGIAKPTLRLSLTRSGDEAALEIADNGIGIPDTAHRSSRHGLRLIRSLTDQLEGALAFVRQNHGGTLARLTFPLVEPQS